MSDIPEPTNIPELIERLRKHTCDCPCREKVDDAAADALESMLKALDVGKITWEANMEHIDNLQARVEALEISLAEYVYCPDTQKMIEYESMRDKAIKLLPEPPE